MCFFVVAHRNFPSMALPVSRHPPAVAAPPTTTRGPEDAGAHETKKKHGLGPFSACLFETFSLPNCMAAWQSADDLEERSALEAAAFARGVEPAGASGFPLTGSILVETWKPTLTK